MTKVQIPNIGFLIYIILIIAIYFLTLLKFFPEIFIHIPLILAIIPISFEALNKLKSGIISTEFFLTIATIISFIGHQEKTMIVVLIIMLIAQYLEKLIEKRTNKEIKSLINLIPTDVLTKINFEEKVIPIDQITLGMKIIVKTGGRIPVDGIIIQGHADINESSLTGESILKEKKIGQKVFAGTFLESGSIVVKVEKIGEDTFFGKIVNLVQEAEQKKAKVSILTDKIASYLVPTLLMLILLTWILTKNLNLVTTLLVFGSPLELTIITPLAILSGIIAAFKNGVLVKGGLVLEKLSKADVIIFDKTGTLTIGKPVITKIESFDNNINETEILKIAAIGEKRSEHVLAQAILAKAKEENILIPDPENYENFPGHGIKITYNNKTYFLGNKHFIESTEHGNIKIEKDLPNGNTKSSSFYIGCDDKLIGKIYITDEIRSNAKLTIQKLKQLGFKELIILSGDKQKIASHIASLLDIPKAYGEVFPDEKLLMIEKFQNENHIVVMVGDGINDAPAIKQANVGIAMGAMAIEPAIDAADIVLVQNDLYKITFIYALSKKIFKVINQNLLIGFFFVHGFGIILTFLGYVDPFRAALFHSITDIAILINSARLINFKLD